ncbi:hypothetical protein ACFLTM_01130 [Candidatus Bipolaricaulota bacterium]
MGSAAEVTLGGSFGGQIESTPSQLFELDRFLFGLTLRGDGWHTSMRATVTGGDFSYLGFSDHRQVGPISLASTLVFDPSQGTFTYVSNLTRFQLEGVGFANYAYYPTQQNQAYDQITLDGFTEGIRWRAVGRFGLCEFDFRTATLRADWVWNPCGIAFGTLLSLSCDHGFDRFRVTLTYPEIPYLSLGPMDTDFILDIDFQTEGKTVFPSLRTRLARASVCFTPLYALDLTAAPLGIDGITLYGVRIEASVENAVEFYAATSFVSARNAALTGNVDYFEVYRLRVRRPSCCGADSLLEVAFYFDETSPWAFDLGMVAASVDFPLSAKGRLNFEVEYPATADWALRLGWQWRF